VREGNEVKYWHDKVTAEIVREGNEVKYWQDKVTSRDSEGRKRSKILA
jgi:hypothetical protein